jgi:hypothetical protein
MADPHPDEAIDLNQAPPPVIEFDLNVPEVADDPDDGQDVRRHVVEVFLPNQNDWDEVRDDVFDHINPIFFNGNEAGRSSNSNLSSSLSFCCL